MSLPVEIVNYCKVNIKLCNNCKLNKICKNPPSILTIYNLNAWVMDIKNEFYKL